MTGDILAPGEVGDEDIDRRALGVDADFAVAAQGDGANVAGRDAVVLDDVDDCRAQLVERVGQGHAVDLGGIDQALHVLGQPKDSRSRGLAVAADSFKYAGAVVDYVAHHVNIRLFPGNELAIAPDFFRRLDGHR